MGVIIPSQDGNPYWRCRQKYFSVFAHFTEPAKDEFNEATSVEFDDGTNLLMKTAKAISSPDVARVLMNKL